MMFVTGVAWTCHGVRGAAECSTGSVRGRAAGLARAGGRGGRGWAVSRAVGWAVCPYVAMSIALSTVAADWRRESAPCADRWSRISLPALSRPRARGSTGCTVVITGTATATRNARGTKATRMARPPRSGELDLDGTRGDRGLEPQEVASQGAKGVACGRSDRERRPRGRRRRSGTDRCVPAACANVTYSAGECGSAPRTLARPLQTQRAPSRGPRQRRGRRFPVQRRPLTYPASRVRRGWPPQVPRAW